LQTPFSAISSTPEMAHKECFNLLCEADRLKTFEGCKWDNVNTQALAENGFFYSQRENKIRCFFCRIIIAQWVARDDINVSHRKYEQRCPFINGYNVGNIPIHRRSPEDKDTTISKFTRETNEMGIRFKSTKDSSITSSDISKLNVIEYNTPKHPNYASYDSRLISYKMWPRKLKQKPENMADAGFYYVGK
jgi:hypothetical protein